MLKTFAPIMLQPKPLEFISVTPPYPNIVMEGEILN